MFGVGNLNLNIQRFTICRSVWGQIKHTCHHCILSHKNPCHMNVVANMWWFIWPYSLSEVIGLHACSKLICSQLFSLSLSAWPICKDEKSDICYLWFIFLSKFIYWLWLYMNFFMYVIFLKLHMQNDHIHTPHIMKFYVKLNDKLL